MGEDDLNLFYDGHYYLRTIATRHGYVSKLSRCGRWLGRLLNAWNSHRNVSPPSTRNRNLNKKNDKEARDDPMQQINGRRAVVLL
jgi:hypothetical protein